METHASILVKGIKQRVYNGDTVYLPNETEFEIEFFNESYRTVCPSITINGEKLKSSPVVYNGQKYILKDFIDIPRKFLFHVYEVEINNGNVKNAIKENGVIEIEYYYEEYRQASMDIRFPSGDNGMSCDPKKIETGKITKGSSSNVRYNMVNILLDRSSFEKQIIKLLPLSLKPKNINCPECEVISSTEANFCSNCGHKF